MNETRKQAITALQAARLDQGWTQSRTIYALQQEAVRQKVTIAEPRSLKPMLSTWENGHGQPSPLYQRLFCAIYDAAEDDLGFAAQDGGRSLAIPRVKPILSGEIVDYFAAVFREHVRADNLLGPHHLVGLVRDQAALLDKLLPDASGDIRDRLLVLANRYNELVGWLYQDAGDPGTAMQFSDRAMDYAIEIDEPYLTSYVLMRKCNIAVDQGNPDRAIGLSDGALRRQADVPPRIRALVLTQRARAYALKGDANECARAIDGAHQAVTGTNVNAEDIAAYCREPYVLMEAAACWTQLGQPDKSVPIFERSLTDWPTLQRRDHGLCRARLAYAYAAQGDVTRACVAADEAIPVIKTATSARALRELQRLRARLASWRRDPAVSDLSERLRSLTRAT